jgi:hypothetical protein
MNRGTRYRPGRAIWLAALAALYPTSALASGFAVSGMGHSSGQSMPLPRPILVAQARCSAADLARSKPPFPCVTTAIFRCLKRNPSGSGGSLEYRGDTSGDIVVKSIVAGDVALLGFQFDAANETLNLRVKRKNALVQEQQIWDGFQKTLTQCR